MLPDFDRVLVATDGSESVRRAVAVAVDLAVRFDARAEALYVLDAADLDGSPEQVRDDLRNALQEAGDEALADVRRRAAERGVPVSTTVREGHPAAEVVAHARETDADVVATGTRGRHGEHRLLVGSVAERVVRRASVPVLTVRRTEA
ncbi:MAG: universal stress protein UspA related nucleotide-binding protein [uncultured archaeon A07HB70]|nr:MAG: universal stress protein UspA related nucleotide-binding protein [uncultured archaeon A07HB70]